MELVTKCYSCGYEIVFAAGENTCRCEACGRTNGRPKSQKNELELMKYSNERLSFGEFDEAENGYRKVLQRTPDEHEARWGLLLCKYGVRYVEDVKTGQRLPTCRRALPTSFVAEPDFRLACEAAPMEVRAQYEKDGRYIDDIQKEIRRLKKSGVQYDIFICYKEKDENKERTLDSVLAQNMHQMLSLRRFNVFYAPKSLKKCLGANYEAAIYVALETSKVMLVLATKPEYLETTWVRSEWKRYLDRIDQGEEKLLIPLYRDFDPEDMPTEFTDRFIQGLDMRDPGFRYALVDFLSQELAEPEPVDIPESAPVQPPAPPQEVSQIEMKINRGFRELKDGDFDAARSCFERALDEDYEHPRANLGMAMVELKVSVEAELQERCLTQQEWANNKYIKRAEDYGDGAMKALFEQLRRACEAEQERKAAEEHARQEAERKAAEECARQEAERKAEEARARQEAERKAAEALAYADAQKYNWIIRDDGAVIVGYKGLDTAIAIPSKIGGRRVTAIGESAFSGCSDLVSVMIPGSVTKIGMWAFSGCSSLMNVTIPGSVREIGYYAFASCPDVCIRVSPGSPIASKLKEQYGDKVKVTAGLQWSGNRPAEDAAGDYEWRTVDGGAVITRYKGSDVEISIPSMIDGKRVTAIGESAFSGCGDLQSVLIPDGVTKIGMWAFSGCSGLKSVIIPGSVRDVGFYAFSSCPDVLVRVKARTSAAEKLKGQYGDKVVFY